MRRSSIIGHVIELLDLVRASRLPADLIVKEFFRKRHYLGAKDRRLISSMVYGVLRRFFLLEAYARDVFRRLGGPGGEIPSLALVLVDAAKTAGEPAETLLLDAGSLWRLHVPSVAPEIFLSALASAPDPSGQTEDPLLSVAIRHSLPRFLVEEWSSVCGADGLEPLCAALNEEAPVVIRVNTLRATVEECRRALATEGIAAEPARWSPAGLVLSKRINAQALRSFNDGWFEMQDEGSQLIGYLAGPVPEMRVVDACAGAGGKTLHCAALMQNRGEILAIDNDPRRLGQLDERLARAGVSIVRTAVSGTDDRLIESWHGQADVVLVDAPCTGSGTLRRNPGLRLRLNEADLRTMSGTQRRILADAALLVRPGGRLVYSTCSLHRDENDHVVSAFLSSHPDFRLDDAVALLRSAGIALSGVVPPAVTLLPSRHGTDGFFLATLIRSAAPGAAPPSG